MAGAAARRRLRYCDIKRLHVASRDASHDCAGVSSGWMMSMMIVEGMVDDKGGGEGIGLGIWWRRRSVGGDDFDVIDVQPTLAGWGARKLAKSWREIYHCGGNANTSIR